MKDKNKFIYILYGKWKSRKKFKSSGRLITQWGRIEEGEGGRRKKEEEEEEGAVDGQGTVPVGS